MNLSESEVKARWNASKNMQDRGQRLDDREEKILDIRINEFNEKTAPVIETYQKRGLIAPVKATGTREEVFSNVIDVLMHFALSNQREIPLTDEEDENVVIRGESAEIDPGEEEDESVVDTEDLEKEEEN